MRALLVFCSWQVDMAVRTQEEMCRSLEILQCFGVLFISHTHTHIYIYILYIHIFSPLPPPYLMK